MARVLDSAGTSQPIKALIEKVKEKRLTSSTDRCKVYHKQYRAGCGEVQVLIGPMTTNPRYQLRL